MKSPTSFFFILFFLLGCLVIPAATPAKESLVGKTVTVVGIAQDGKLGALIVAGRETYYLQGKTAWEPQRLNQTLRVTGILRKINLPVATQQDGVWSAGVTGAGIAYALDGFQIERADPAFDLIQQLKDPAKSPDQKWEISRKIQDAGVAAIPSLIDCLQDPAPIGEKPPAGGECVNLPGHIPPPPQCKSPLRTETLGERCEMLLYNIVTPAYTSPYMYSITAKQAPPPPFRIPDWKKWWQKHRSEDLVQIHQQARAKIDAFWQNNHRSSIVWD